MKFYSKISTEENITPSIFYLITSHHPPCQLNRTWRIILWDHKIFICTRCLGQYIGVVAGIISIIILDLKINNLILALLVFGILPFPSTFDWLIQTITKRESLNYIRICVGFLFGLNIGIFLGCGLVYNWNAICWALLIYFIYISFVIFLLKKMNIISDYLKPYENFLNR